VAGSFAPPGAAEARALFLAGCLGPDVFFYDRLPPPLFRRHTKKTVGNAFHNMDAALWWKHCRPFAEDTLLRPYLAGLLCHFALDAAVHPYICSVAQGAEHTRLEARIDSLLFSQADGELYPLRALDLPALRAIDAFWQGLSPALLPIGHKNAYIRSYRNFRFFSRLSFDGTGRKLRFVLGLEKLFGRTGLISGFLVSTRAIFEGDILNLQRAAWAAPWKPEELRNESYMGLYESACEEAAELVRWLYNKEEDEIATRLRDRSMQKGTL